MGNSNGTPNPKADDLRTGGPQQAGRGPICADGCLSCGRGGNLIQPGKIYFISESGNKNYYTNALISIVRPIRVVVFGDGSADGCLFCGRGGSPSTLHPTPLYYIYREDGRADGCLSCRRVCTPSTLHPTPYTRIYIYIYIYIAGMGAQMAASPAGVGVNPNPYTLNPKP